MLRKFVVSVTMGGTMTPIDRNTAAAIVRATLRRRAITKTDMAAEAGVSPKTFGRIANAVGQVPRESSHLAVARTLDRVDGERFLAALGIDMPERFRFRDDPPITTGDFGELGRLVERLGPTQLRSVVEFARFQLREDESG